VLLVLGGLAMAISPVLPFLSLKLNLGGGGGEPVESDLGGFDIDVGPYFLAFGVLMILAAAVLWLTRGRWRVVVALVAVALSAYGVYLGIANIGDLPQDSLEGFAEQGAAGGDVEALSDIANFDPGIGLFLATGGAVLASMGALIALKPAPAPDPRDTPLPAGWTPPADRGPVTQTEPRGEPEGAWSPPNVDHPAEVVSPPSEQRSPWEPPDRNPSGGL
jgi:hypothetical protein